MSNLFGFSPSFRRRPRPPISGWVSFGHSFGKHGFIDVPAAVAKIHVCCRIPESLAIPKTRFDAKNNVNAPHLGAFCVFIAFLEEVLKSKSFYERSLEISQNCQQKLYVRQSQQKKYFLCIFNWSPNGPFGDRIGRPRRLNRINSLRNVDSVSFSHPEFP